MLTEIWLEGERVRRREERREEGSGAEGCGRVLSALGRLFVMEGGEAIRRAHLHEGTCSFLLELAF
jgi:hypothetical protein